jgi:serine/threonine protein kinase
MNLATATLADGSTIQFWDGDPMSGTEKDVYFSKDKKSVVCFYKDADATRLQRLEAIINVFDPTAPGQSRNEYWKTLFCWPTAIVVKPKLGVVAPAYPSNFFFPKCGSCPDFSGAEKSGGWFVKPKSRSKLRRHAPEQLGDFRTNVAMVIKLARAVRRLHSAGLAHSDLSYKNVLLDPNSGSACIIDIDSLVVNGLFPATVMGTPGFIAPEVLGTQHLQLDDKKRAHPNIHTDKHALASLVYQYLLQRDPIKGPKVHDPDTGRDEFLMMGPKALFIEHPTDRTNRPGDIKVTVDRLGPYLAPVFLRSFVDGLHAPDRRPLAADYEQALVKTYNILVPCVNPRCEAKCFPCWVGAQPVCPFCGSRHTVPFPILTLMKQARPGTFVNECELACFRGMPLFPHHVFSNLHPGEHATDKDRTPLAIVDFIDGKWALINHGLTSMVSTSGNRVQPGQATLLTPGSRFQLSQDQHGRLAEVVMV